MLPVRLITSKMTRAPAAIEQQLVPPPHMRSAPAEIGTLTATSTVLTIKGPRLASALSVGDRILTRDHGYQPICYRRIFTPSEPHLRTAASLMGLSSPLSIPTDGRLLLRSPMVQSVFNTDEALAPGHLLHKIGVAQPCETDHRSVFIAFPNHEVIFCDGAQMAAGRFTAGNWSAYPRSVRREVIAQLSQDSPSQNPHRSTARETLTEEHIPLLLALIGSGCSRAVA